MTDDLFTPVDLAVLSSLDDQPREATRLLPATVMPGHFPNDRAVASKLGHLRSRGLAEMTDTGGPAKTRRKLWTITPAGTAILDAYRATHRSPT